MAGETCLPAKRSRLDKNQECCVKAILTDEYSNEPPLIKVYLSQLENKCQISKVMQELSKTLPMEQMGLQHLKRVRQKEIILCRLTDVKEKSIKQYLEEAGLSKDVVALLSKSIIAYDVSANAPMLRWQYELVQQRWPCKFHPNKYMELLNSGEIFSKKQLDYHSKIMDLLSTISIELENGNPCGICIDPRTNSIVAVAASKTTSNPIMHGPMVLIDFVARTQRSGAWQKEFECDFTDVENDFKCNNSKAVANGVPISFMKLMNADQRFKDIQVGAEPPRSKSDIIITEQTMHANVDNLEKYGPYLCTGYDLYFTHEPCLMCAMALVHSRARRIFFENRSANGALVSRLKLHSVKELNHHYEVFEFKPSSSNEELS